jgi:hypothetical protein
MVSVDWIHMAQYQGNCSATVSMIIDPHVPLHVQNLLTSFSKRPLLHSVRYKVHHTFKLLYSYWVFNFTAYHGQDEPW